MPVARKLDEEFWSDLIDKHGLRKFSDNDGSNSDGAIWNDPAPIGRGRYSTGAWQEPREKYPMDKDIGIGRLPHSQNKSLTIEQILETILGRSR